jgi:hypothetical protein
MCEVYFSPICIISPAILFQDYNSNPTIATIKVILYKINKEGIFIKNAFIEDVMLSDYMFITGVFQFLQPYILYTAKVKVNKNTIHGIKNAKLEKIVKCAMFDLEDSIFYKPESKLCVESKKIESKKKESEQTTSRIAVYDYICMEEFQYEAKIKLKNNNELAEEYLEIFKIHKSFNRLLWIKNIIENAKLYETFFKSTLYFQLDASIRTYEYFYRDMLPKDKFGIDKKMKLQTFEEHIELNKYMMSLDYNLLLMEGFAFYNNLTLKTLSIFIRNFVCMVDNEESLKHIKRFLLCGVILICLQQNGNSDYTEITQLKNQVFEHFDQLNTILKEYSIKGKQKNTNFRIIKENIKNTYINDYINDVFEFLVKERHVVVFTRENTQYMYFSEVFNVQKSICESLCKIQLNLIKYSNEVLDQKNVQRLFEKDHEHVVKENLLNEIQAEFFYRICEYDFSFYLLKGKPGTGKTTTIFHIIKTLLHLKESNVLLTSFQGSTKENLNQKVLLKLFPCETYNSFISKMTMHKFISRVTSLDKEIHETTDSEMDATVLYDLEDCNIDQFRRYYDGLKIVIIDEFSNVSIDLFMEFMIKIKDKAIKIIMVGDDEQCGSFDSISLMRKMEEFIKTKKKGNVVELQKSNRFNEDTDGYIQHNIDLVYAKSDELESKFKHGKDNSVEVLSYSSELFQKCSEIVKKHNKSDVEIFTFRNSGEKDSTGNGSKGKIGVDEINTSIFIRGFMQGSYSDENTEYEKAYRSLLRDDFDQDSVIRPGNKILNKSNTSSRTLENCYIFKYNSKDDNQLGVSFLMKLKRIMEFQKNNPDDNPRMNRTSFKHNNNTFSFFKTLDDLSSSKDKKSALLELQDCTSDYIANGTSGYIIDIRYGVQFIPKNDSKSVREATINKKTFKTICNTHWMSSIKIVTLLTNELDIDGNQKKKTIIVGRGVVEEKNIRLGYCRTIDSVQGMEFKVGILIIPNVTLGKWSENLFCVNRLLVALSRAKEKMYILIDSRIEVNEHALKNKENYEKTEWIMKILNDKQKYYSPMQVLQHITSNQSFEKKTFFVDILSSCYSKMIRDKNNETMEDDQGAKKRQKIV